MFTGIIEATAEVITRTETQLTLERPATFDDIKIGSSIAVAGVCLSVIAFDDATITFDVVDETWDKTKLGTLAAGDRVNLERAMLATDRFDGHIVQGHIEGIGNVQVLKRSNDQATLTIEVPPTLALIVVTKGSITVDGVALTSATIEQNICSIALVPHTLENTTLGSLQPGDSVNVETDVIGRYVYSFMNHAD